MDMMMIMKASATYIEDEPLDNHGKVEKTGEEEEETSTS